MTTGKSLEFPPKPQLNPIKWSTELRRERKKCTKITQIRWQVKFSGFVILPLFLPHHADYKICSNVAVAAAAAAVAMATAAVAAAASADRAAAAVCNLASRGGAPLRLSPRQEAKLRAAEVRRLWREARGKFGETFEDEDDRIGHGLRCLLPTSHPWNRMYQVSFSR